MLTLFTLPKPFVGESVRLQNNALESWRCLHPDIQIIVMGNEEGIADAAERHSVEHVGEIARSAQGTPLLSDAFAKARALARHQRLAYANADIIFFSDLIAAVAGIALDAFVAVGRRVDVDIDFDVDVRAADWEQSLRGHARARGRLHEPTGMDYFVFPKNLFQDLLPFPVGRPIWDNWFIYHARELGIPVVDATAAVTAIHQNHSYRHVEGPRQAAYEAEIRENWRMVGPDFVQLTIDDATWMLDASGLHKANDLRHLARRAIVAPALWRHTRFFVRYARAAYRVARGAGTGA
jgi:hypothetical protein